MGVIVGRSYDPVFFKRTLSGGSDAKETKGVRENHERPAEGQCRGHDRRSGALSRCRPWEQEAVTRFWVHSGRRASRDLEEMSVVRKRKRD